KTVLGPPKRFAPLRNTSYLDACWSGDGRLLVATYRRRQRALAYSTARPGRPFAGHQGAIASVAASPDGRWAAAGCWGGSPIKVWDGERGELAWQHPCTQGTVAFSPDGRWLATAVDDKVVRFWKLGSWEAGLELAREEPVPGHLAFSADGTVLAF